MKRKHILLFLVSCLLLYIGDIFASGLIALALIFQMNLLFQDIPLTKASQVAAFKLFLFSIPLFFFLGAIHSFIFVYFHDSNWPFLLAAIFIAYSLFFVVNFFSFFVFHYLEKNQFKITAAIQNAMNDIHKNKRGLLTQTTCLFILSLIPFLNTEWKIIFSLMAYRLYLSRQHLKQVFDSSR
jgi:hypothetical protein